MPLEQPNIVMEPLNRPAVGAYWIGDGIGFHMLTRPSWFHRLMMRLLLGWVWKDN